MWYLAATPLLEIVYWVIVQVRLAHPGTDARILDVVFAMDQVCYALAALSFLTAPIEPPQEDRRVSVMRDVNPLPAVAVLAVGGLLIRTAISRTSESALLVVASGMVIVAVLLIARILVAAHDRLTLLREEAALESRLHDDRVAALRRIAGGIAHEFNNLMTVVIGMAEIGDMNTREAESRSHFQAIAQAGRRAAALTSRLLTYSGGRPTLRVPLSLRDLLSDLTPKIHEIGARHATTVAPADVPPVLANREQIEQAVLHLVANSAAATPPGGSIAIDLRTTALDAAMLDDAVLPAAPVRYVTITVADSGRGIPPEHRRRVFDPFYSTASLAEASGLGLAVVYGTIVSHGGAIMLRDGAGCGTVVELHVPVAETQGTD